jgi:hypothetical protein
VTRAVWTKPNALPVFAALQCLDVVTTLIFLSKGVREGNPLVSWTLPYLHSQLIGLIAAKLLAMIIGVWCYRNGKISALRIANIGYSAIIGWNLLTIAMISFTA